MTAGGVLRALSRIWPSVQVAFECQCRQSLERMEGCCANLPCAHRFGPCRVEASPLSRHFPFLVADSTVPFNDVATYLKGQFGTGRTPGPCPARTIYRPVSLTVRKDS